MQEDLRRKEDLVRTKSDSAIAEVAISSAFREAVNKIKLNIEKYRATLSIHEKLIFEEVVFPSDVGSFEIRPELLGDNELIRSRVMTDQSNNQKHRGKIVQFFR